MNQPYARVNQPYATLTLASALREMFGVQLYKNNARALLSRILSILNLDWLQHARSVRGVYECVIWDPRSRSEESGCVYILSQEPLTQCYACLTSHGCIVYAESKHDDIWNCFYADSLSINTALTWSVLQSWLWHSTYLLHMVVSLKEDFPVLLIQYQALHIQISPTSYVGLI